MICSHRVGGERRKSSFRWIILMCVIASGLAVSQTAWAQNPPTLVGWAISQPTDVNAIQNGGSYIPIGWAESPDYPNAIVGNTQAGLPTGIETRGQFASQIDPKLTWISTNGYALNYLFMDLEYSPVSTNNQYVQDVINRVRHDPNPNISNAWMGNYGYYAGAGADSAYQWPLLYGAADLVAKDNFYRTSGLHVAMPSLYPYSYYLTHTSAVINGQAFIGGAAPNQRSALFWAPLEHLSTAKRNLPAGDKLIPWVNDFIQNYGGNGDPANTPYRVTQDQLPTPQDNAASIQHYRLRGVDGYSVFLANIDQQYVKTYYYQTYGAGATAAYARDMAIAWHALDPLFNRPGAKRILNLDTNKSGGIEWSGVGKGNRAGVLVSNLNTTTQTVNWAGKLQLPAQSPTVAPGTHVLLQYRTSYLDNNDMRQYTAGNAMNHQGANSWSGPQPGAFSASAPPDSSPAVVSTGAYAYQRAWYTSSNPGYIATDKVVYSAWLYNGNSVAGFAPANTVGASPTDMPDSNHEGPSIWIDGGNLKFKSLFDGGTTYSAVNLPRIANKWYEVQMVVDPTVGAGLGSVWVRNVAAGQKDFTRVVFTTGADRLLYVPLSLDVNRTTTSFNGWSIEAYGAGNAISNLNTGYYVPRMDDNFEHYQTGVTNNNQPINEIKWYGPTGTGAHGPSEWTVAAPYGSGNSSALAATPTSTAYTPRAWWKTERPDFTVTEPTVYSAQLYGASGVGFEAVNTTGNSATALTNNNQVSFYAYIYWGALRFRPSRASGDNYQATNFTAQSGKWYDVQVQIDQTRDIDGTTGGNYGVARIWVKNLTDNTAPILLSFDDINTTTVEALTELPMFLSTNLNNPTLWDGWEVYGYNQSVQIDGLRSFLYPFNDFGAYNQYIDEVNTHTAFFIPEPATCALLAFGMFGLFRRPLAR